MTTTATKSSCPSQLGPAIRQATLRTMTQMSEQEPKIVEKPGPATEDGISAMLAYQGDAVFTLVLSLPRVTVAPLIKTFTGVAIAWEAEILEDVVGELLNVIGGDVAAELAGLGVEVQLGLPRVARTLDMAECVPGGTVLDDFGVSDRHGKYRVTTVAPEKKE